ncbi:MAG TPA: hypothetical protein VF293_06860, partial [Candidatus Limnocylindrales bacterium]
ESGERAISLETLRKLGVALGIVFLVGSTDAASAVAADPRAVVVPEAPIETTSVKEPRQAGSTPHKRSVKLARGGGLAIPAVRRLGSMRPREVEVGAQAGRPPAACRPFQPKARTSRRFFFGATWFPVMAAFRASWRDLHVPRRRASRGPRLSALRFHGIPMGVVLCGSEQPTKRRQRSTRTGQLGFERD